MSAIKTEVTVKVLGVEKRLFTIRERENGDLHISLHHAEFYRPIGQQISTEQPRILHQHYSVHRSEKSPNRINVIKQTLKLSDGQEITTPIYTRAVKQTNRYASLYTSRSTSLRSERYDFAGHDCTSLCAFHPSTSTFFHMLLVSDAEKPCMFSPSPDFDFRVFTFTHFKIVVLWSFARVPAWDAGAKIHSLTVDGFDELFEENMVMDGYEDEMLLRIYRDNIQELQKEVIKLIAIEQPSLVEMLPFMCELGFLNFSPSPPRPDGL